MKHKKLVDRVMKMLLEGQDEFLYKLRIQFESSEILSEEESGVGIFVDFESHKDQIELEPIKGRIIFGDVIGMIQKKPIVGFLLYIEDGLITTLEGYTLGDELWLDNEDEIELSYDTGMQHDLESLK